MIAVSLNKSDKKGENNGGSAGHKGQTKQQISQFFSYVNIGSLNSRILFMKSETSSPISSFFFLLTTMGSVKVKENARKRRLNEIILEFQIVFVSRFLNHFKDFKF